MADFDMLSGSGIDFLAIVVDRKDVERCDIGSTLLILNRLLEDREVVQRFRNRVDLAFHGYDEDRRELHEIEEVRRFAAELDKKFPFWFYFLSLNSDTLFVLLLCLCRYSKNQNNAMNLDKDETERFLVEHFEAINWLFQTYHLGEDDKERLSEQVMVYLRQYRKPLIIQ